MLSIGKFSATTGVKVPTIRYYEEIGLLPEPQRSASNQRLYDPKLRERLGFIRHARELGFPLEAVRELLSLTDQPDHDCAAVDDIAARQLAAVKARITRLEALKDELERMLEHSGAGVVSSCRVIEVLGDHSHCLHASHKIEPLTEAGPE